ncbi:MAG: EAL domain-containing protein, partial [Bryobacteraceae bacterium]
WETMHQRSAEDWHMKTDAEIFGPEVADQCRLNDLKVTHTGVSAQTIEILSRGRETTYWMVTTFPVKTTRAGGGMVGAIALDITQRRLAEQSIIVRLLQQANHDSLTALPNRFLFEDRLEKALEAASCQSVQSCLLWIDLDRFKEINETLGHHIGDILLIQAAERLHRCCGESDTLARLGGDEFALLRPKIHSSADAEVLADAILASIRKPFYIERHELYITASIGICSYPGDGFNAATLQCNAERAMYLAKNHGRNAYRCYESAISAGALERLNLEGELRHALNRNEFELFYQPQFNLKDELKGFEALIRWNHPEHGLLSPGDFIPLAEECGLIVPIGAWVVRQACRQLAAWRAELPGIHIAVNVSASQLHYADLVGTIRDALTESGIDAACLEIELTESLVMRNYEESVRQLQGLRALGISIAIDDFGTGYSCLSKLRTLPVNKLKIDKSFLIDIESSTNAAVVTAIAALSRSLGLSVVAEGVEQQEQLTALKAIGVDLIQGFLLGHPMPASVTEARFFH